MRILITGKKSYVGLSLKEWLGKGASDFVIDFISVRNKDWKNHDFTKYDVLINTAAIVHAHNKNYSEADYFNVNRDLALDIAGKAQKAGIKQYIFLSTLSVYGLDGDFNRDAIIDAQTPLNPKTAYGRSKLEAEMKLRNIETPDFKVTILRVPMIYGPRCPGNYTRLRNFALKLPVFPQVQNERSMIFIYNLCEFIKQIILKQESGLFIPQDQEYVSTISLIKEIRKNHHKTVFVSGLLRPFLNFIPNGVKQKVFGNLIVDKKMSAYNNFKYCIYNFEQSITLCEENLNSGDTQ